MTVKDLRCGHRQRLREKFLISKESLNDYELLEMVLFASNVRKDTKMLAKKLIEHFGCLSNVLNANINDLELFENMGTSNAVSIKCVKEIINRVLKSKIVKKTINFHSIDDIENYCISTMGYENVEKIKVLFLNSKFELIKEEYLGSGSINEVKLYKSLLISRAIQYSCYNIILVHNHPSGDPKPSEKDIELTFNLQELLSMLDMKLIDHIIASNNKCFSMLKNKMIKNLIK